MAMALWSSPTDSPLELKKLPSAWFEKLEFSTVEVFHSYLLHHVQEEEVKLCSREEKRAFPKACLMLLSESFTSSEKTLVKRKECSLAKVTL